MKRRTFVEYTGIGITGTIFLPAWASDNENPVKQDTPLLPVSSKAKYLWYNTKAEGRNLFANFRKKIVLKGKPQKAFLHLFADTHYQLFVNGAFVEFGPVRFDPRYPQYDTHSFINLLKAGENVIAIQVNHFGCKTYKSIQAKAGMICWGQIETDLETVSLDSEPQNWKVMPAEEYETLYGHKLSFALNPMAYYVQEKEQRGWKNVGFSDSNWNNAVAVEKQTIWGKPEQRTIPYMSGHTIPIYNVAQLLPIAKYEERYSFRVPYPDFYEEKKQNSPPYTAFKTYIYSEKDQTVSVGTFWGEVWINGEEVPAGTYAEDRGLRMNQLWTLKKGWNFIFGKVGPYFDVLNHYFSFPLNKGIIISADKKMTEGEVLFYVMSKITSDKFEKLKNKKLPFDEQDAIIEFGGWQPFTYKDRAQSPCMEASWDNFGFPLEEKPKVADIVGFIFKKEKYPDGVYLLLDLEYMHLFYPQIKLKGVKNAIIDLVYTEMLTYDQVHQWLVFNYQPGDRLFCSENELQWTSPHPRGARYLGIYIRNTENDITLENIVCRSANYPTTLRGSLQTSDPTLNEIWKAGARTQAIDMEDAYVDCVSRERGMYGRDTIIQYINNLALFGDQKLMGRCMQLYGQSPDATGKFRAVYPNTGDYTISDFALNMLEGYWVYYQNSGDKKRIQEDWNAIKGNLAWFNKLADQRPDMLLDAEWDKKQGIKAHYGGFHGDLGIVKDYMSVSGIHCVFSCTYLIALQSALYLAKAIGATQDIPDLERRISKLSVEIEKAFWNPEKGCYADNLERETHSAHASIFIARAGILPASKKESVKKHVTYTLRSLFLDGIDPDSGVYFSPSFAFYIFDGLYILGLESLAENLMKQGWSLPLTKGIKTTPEYFHFRPQNSMSHGWSSSPTYYLSKYILGVTFPKAPDFSYVEINVKTANVTYAEGSYPVPIGGKVEVKWHIDENGKRIFDFINVPKGTTYKIIG